MISFNEALSIVLDKSFLLGVKTVKLQDSIGCVLAKDILTRYDIPFFDNSAVDGFGVKISDIKDASKGCPVKLKLIGEVKAGDVLRKKLFKGEAVKILTGTLIPQGVEAVVMKEYSYEDSNYVYLKKAARHGSNIRKKGEEYSKNTLVLSKGTKITPPVVGLLATLGCNSCLVYKKPHISIIVTGSELMQPGRKLGLGKIYESNSYALAACLDGLGIKDYKITVTKDEKRTIKKHIKNALNNSDVVITVGGISVGDYDFVKDILVNVGIKTFFTEVAMKPAKPNYFGIYSKNKKRRLIFGLPGNPVSSLVSFHQIIKPSLLKMMGQINIHHFNTKAVLAANLKKKINRLEFVRGFAEQKNGSLLVKPTKGQGSHMLSGIANANCLIGFPREKDWIHKGEYVNIELISWN